MLELFIIYLIGIVPAFFMVGIINIFLPEEKAPSGFYILSWFAFIIVFIILGFNFIALPLHEGFKKNCTDLPEKTVRYIINIFKKH